MLRHLALLTLLATRLLADITPASVAVIYNTKSPESKTLAEYYAHRRNIPRENLIGISTSTADHISRAEYDSTIADPLRKIFTQNNFWSLAKTPQGTSTPITKKFNVLVCMYGVPFGITRANLPESTADKGGNAVIMKSNEASVDSELTLLGVQGVPIKGAIPNPYFQQDAKVTDFPKLKEVFLVGRIDGPSLTTCKRLIDDAIITEASGLWGMCYLDLAQKGGGYKQGDDWIKNIEKKNWEIGIPTVIDKNSDTYVTNYPMRDAALYYGWYTTHTNGPFLNPAFKFRRGAIAVHLHSFSATKLRDATTHWVGPLLEKGAAATLGNVFEPYLALTHHFDVFNDRLLKGYTFIEASYMAMPAFSWQGVAIGDPLYRPYKHIDGSGSIQEEDKFYRAIRVAQQRWATDPETFVAKIRSVGAKKSDGRYYEILGLRYRFLQDKPSATAFLNSASKNYLSPYDQIRISLMLADIYRESNQKNLAVSTLTTSLQGNEDEPEAKALQATLNILQPPPPPPATPK